MGAQHMMKIESLHLEISLDTLKHPSQPSTHVVISTTQKHFAFLSDKRVLNNYKGMA
jgi:hypothetical protein